MLADLTHKVAVITGGASGIGLALAHACAAHGMRLVLADIEAQPLALAAAALAANGAQVLTQVTDVADYAAVERLAQAAFAHYGGVHLLVNNAGVAAGGAAGGAIWETTLNDWAWVLGVNLWGVIHGVRAFMPHLLAQDAASHIVNTASIAGLIAGPSMGAYRVSKHAVVALSETLYLELRQSGAPVGVSVLCPAWVNTAIFNAERNRPAALANAASAPAPASDDPLLRAQLQMAADSVAAGSPPQAIAAAVLDAVRSDRFYILTHEPFTGAVAIRLRDILAGNNPTNLLLPR